MSRIGKKIIHIPPNVSVTIENQKVRVKGTYGILEQSFTNILEISQENNQVKVKRLQEDKASKCYHGLIRAIVQNMVKGVDEQFSKILIAEGVGYKFQIEKGNLIINAGFTHSVPLLIPSDISIKIETPTKVILSGIDKEKLGFFASKIRQIRPPEPYKGKGILYNGEKIRRKAGKTGKTGK